MKRKSFWAGYALAMAAVVWLLMRQRREDVERAVQRLRESRPEGMDLPFMMHRGEEARAEEPARGASSPATVPAEKAVDDSEKPADDLEVINGIGPAFARRLNDAGIMRFAQLSKLTPDEIRQRASLEPWQGDVESWIEQAKGLAGE